MKHSILFIGLYLLLSACGSDAAGPLPTDSEPKIETNRPTLPLPALPNYLKSSNRLSEDDQGDIYFPTRSPYDFSRVLNGYENVPIMTGKGTLLMPKNAGKDSPVPAMVILHGSGGIQDGREFTYANWFAENGIAGFVVDYYEPRGVTDETPYLMKTMAATEVDIIADAYAALNILGTHPNIDADRIGVTGYSYGGMATRYTLDKRIKDIMAPNIAPFALHMDIYGPCHQSTGSWVTTGSPYLAIYGDTDNSVDPAKCTEVQDNLRSGGSDVEALLIEGAGHAWENTKPQSEFGGSYVRGCEFSWEPETGVFMVNGQTGEFQPEPDMTREERAAVRAGLGSLAGGCIGQGYTVGSNPAADKISKAKQLTFMKRHFKIAE